MMRGRMLIAAVLLASCRGASAPPSLVVAYPLGPASLVPDTANEEFTISILSNVYESLTDFDAKLSIIPGLAESWYSQDDLTWVFRLRPGVRFHDGRPLETADVVASLERARNDPASKRRGELGVIESVRRGDGGTVVVKTRAPSAAIPHRFANVAIWRADPDPGRPPLGTGPYRFKTWAARGDSVLEAFPAYWGGAPPIAVLEFKVIPDAADRIRALGSGRVHVVVDVSPGAIPTLEEGGGVRVLTEKGLRVIFLGFDCAKGPFRDPRARRAVALAIDREGLVRGPLGGYAEIVDQVVAPAVFGYDETLAPFPHDVAEARRLLGAAGLGSGVSLDLDFMPSKYRAMDAVVSGLSSDLRSIGIAVRQRPSEAADFITRVERHDATLFLWGWMSTGGDANVSYDYLLRSPRDGFGVDNGGAYSNLEVDRLLEQATHELDPRKRKELLSAVARRIQADAAVVPLYRQTDLYGVAKDLDFRPRVDRRIRGAHLGWRTP